MMQETKKSLKYYFIIIGIFGLLGLSRINIFNESITAGALQLIYIILGVLFLYIGLKINFLLSRSPKFINNILFFNLGFILINTFYNLSKGLLVGINLFSLIINFIVTIYLIRNINKLSSQENDLQIKNSSSLQSRINPTGLLVFLIIVGLLLLWHFSYINSGNYKSSETKRLIENRFSDTDTSLLPMYGEIDKTPREKQLDQEFIQTMITNFGNNQTAAQDAISKGNDFLNKGDLDMAMRRFNQAWLLDANNPDIYIGFGDILKQKGQKAEANEMYNKAENLKK